MSYIRLQSTGILLMGITYLISQFIDSPLLPKLVSIFAFITLVLFIPYLTKVPRILISSLLILTILLSIFGEGLLTMLWSFDENAGLLAIFIFVPLISIPIKAGRYLDSMDVIFTSYVRSTKQLYNYLAFSTMGVGSVMNLGSIPIIHQLTSTEAFDHHMDTKLRAMNRGFSMAFMWSPYFISVALVLSYFDISWLELFPYGFALALIGMVIGTIAQGKNSQPIAVQQEAVDEQTLKNARRKVMQLLTLIITMTGITILLEQFVDLSMITIVPLVAIGFSTVWTLFYLSPKQFAEKLSEYAQDRLPKMGNELSLFIAAGAFGYAIIQAGASDLVIFFLQSTGITHVLVLLPLIALLINVLSFIGIHPIITNTALATTFSSSIIFAGDHLILSLGILSGWMLTIMISPFSATNLMVGNLVGSNSLRVGYKLNFHFGLLIYLVQYLMICGFYYFL
ncbi:hypothetical protein ACFFJI_10180 [Allobacillus sp. GCM10007491]|uniref:Uncharacterized protein n=1 Tax=Allobacillus saliphilus TaxID=2912308 RepID=A0A941HS33_9BACI|nr:hypothetical protein [Allobacillus saliphilus]MBR7552592.1 hypothetical protein [Allobacillus saliphilus]